MRASIAAFRGRRYSSGTALPHARARARVYKQSRHHVRLLLRSRAYIHSINIYSRRLLLEENARFSSRVFGQSK